jgi:beta-lactamase superfamily II metal-dependent hydrolase
MNIITAGVGQGALTIVRHGGEAIIVDSRIPPADDDTVAFVKELLAVSLKGHYVKGFILTGFDDDHCDTVGTSIIMRKYRPDWVMYPKYHKDTSEAKSVFAIIDEEERTRRTSTKPLKRISVRLDRLADRKLGGLSDQFDFELFSPHIEDMDCSNNCSIVLKLTGRGPRGFSYLITGDEEHCEDRSTGPVESPDGQLAEPCAGRKRRAGRRSLGPRPSTAMSAGRPTGTKGRPGPRPGSRSRSRRDHRRTPR